MKFRLFTGERMVMSAEDVGRQKRSRKRRHPQKRHVHVTDFPKLQQRSLNALFEYYEAHEAVCKLMKKESRQQAEVDVAIDRLRKSIEERSKCDRLVDQHLLDNHIDFPQATNVPHIPSNLALNTNDAKSDKWNQTAAHCSDMIADNRSDINAPQHDRSDNNGPTSKNKEEFIVENIRRWFVENKAVKDCEQRYMDIVEVVDAFLADAKKTIQTAESTASTQTITTDNYPLQNIRNDDSIAIVAHDNSGAMLNNEQKIAVQTDRQYLTVEVVEENKKSELRMNTEATSGNSLTSEAIMDRRETPLSILIIDKEDDGVSRNAKNDEKTSCTIPNSNGGIDLCNVRVERPHECTAECVMECADEWEQQCLARVPTHDALLSEANKNDDRSETPMSIIILDDNDSNIQDNENNEMIGWDYINSDNNTDDDRLRTFMNVGSASETVRVNESNNEWEARYLTHDTFLNEKMTTSRGGTPLPVIMTNEYVDAGSCGQPSETTFVNSDNASDTDVVNKKENYIDGELMAKTMFENIVECEECVTVENLTPSLQPHAEDLRNIEMEVFDEWFMEIRKERECHKRLSEELQANEKQTSGTSLMEFIFINSKYKSMRRKLSRSHVICYKTMEKLQKMEENNEKLNRRIHELTEKLNRRDMEAMKQLLEYDHIKASLNEAKESLEKQRKQNDELFEKLNSSECQLFILQDALNTISTCNVELSTYLEQTRIEITATKAQCELLKEEKNALEKQADALKATALTARQAYMESASRLDVVMGANKQIAEERDALKKQRNTIYWNPYGEMICSLQSNIGAIQSPVTTSPGVNGLNCVILPGAADPSTIVGANDFMAMRHPLPQMPFTQYPQIQAAPALLGGTQHSSTKASVATAKINMRRRRPRAGNIDAQTPLTTTPHEDASRSQENIDQRGDSPINVVDMP
uniref:Uncharacterized protein n=1 Tax=Parascaris univalens TaxID=6257 RepID=A0A915ALA6_PARUN